MRYGVISTARLILREPRTSDAQAIFSGYASDPLATRYLTWLPHSDLDVTLRHLTSLAEKREPRDELAWVLCEREREASALGMISLRVSGFKAELGYVVARSVWGRGYMPEAVRAIVALALQDGLYRVSAYCDVENVQSVRVLEKAGLTREGLLRRYALLPNVSHEPRDVYMFAASR